MSLVSHLDELRARLVICLAAVVLCFVVSLSFSKMILGFLTSPVEPIPTETDDKILTLFVDETGTIKLGAGGALPDFKTLSNQHLRLIQANPDATSVTLKSAPSLLIGPEPKRRVYYMTPMDPVLMPLKVAFISGLILALPVILWQIWMFISPGLTEKERKVIKPMLSGAVILFPLGTVFAFIMVKIVLSVVRFYMVDNADMMLNISNYLSFLFTMMLVFGVIFEVPLAIAIAARVGLITSKMLTHYRKHAYIGMLAIAMMISPGADPTTTILAFLPLILLYELAIGLAIPMAKMHERDNMAQSEAPEEKVSA